MTALHQEVYGHGDPVVMLHGWAMHTGVWRDFAQLLAAEHQVICLDLPGHGLSTSIAPYTLDAVVNAIYKQLPEQGVALVGWSLGGNIALRLAEKYPQCVKSLLLIATNPHFLETDSWPGMSPQLVQEFASNLQKNCMQTLMRFLSLQVQGKPDTKSSLKQIKRAMQECALPEAEALMGGLNVLKTIDQRKTLSNLNKPVLMILGELDTLVPESVGRQCQLLSPQIDLKIIPGAGHIPFITDQKRLLTLMQEFMLRNSS